MCLSSDFGCAFPFLARVLGCVWLCVCFAPTPPILAGVRGVCVWVRALSFHPATPCWRVGVCMFVCALRLNPSNASLGLGVCVFVCALRLCPASPGWVCGLVVCLGLTFGCAPPLLRGVLGCMWLCVRSALKPPILAGVPGACVLVCVLAFTPSILAGMLVCVCLCVHFVCAPPILARVFGVRVYAWARVAVAPCHPRLGCWGVCVGVRPPPVPRNSWLGLVVRVCRFGFSPSPCHSWLGCLRVCVCVRAPLYPVIPGSGVRCGCVCLASGFSCALPFLAWVLGCVLLCTHSASTPHILAGVRGAYVCVRVLGFHPTHPGWGVRLFVFARSASAPPILAAVCGAVVRSWVPVSVAPRHS